MTAPGCRFVCPSTVRPSVVTCPTLQTMECSVIKTACCGCPNNFSGSTLFNIERTKTNPRPRVKDNFIEGLSKMHCGCSQPFEPKFFKFRREWTWHEWQDGEAGLKQVLVYSCSVATNMLNRPTTYQNVSARHNVLKFYYLQDSRIQDSGFWKCSVEC